MLLFYKVYLILIVQLYFGMLLSCNFGVTCESRKCSLCQHDASAALPPSQLQTLHSRLHMVSDQQSMKDVWLRLNPSGPVADRFLHDVRGQHAVERMRKE